MNTSKDQQRRDKDVEQLDATESNKWDQLVGLSLAIPGAKVDRDSFLRAQLSSYCNEEQVAKGSVTQNLNQLSG